MLQEIETRMFTVPFITVKIEDHVTTQQYSEWLNKL